MKKKLPKKNSQNWRSVATAQANMLKRSYDHVEFANEELKKCRTECAKQYTKIKLLRYTRNLLLIAVGGIMVLFMTYVLSQNPQVMHITKTLEYHDGKLWDCSEDFCKEIGP